MFYSYELATRRSNLCICSSLTNTELFSGFNSSEVDCSSSGFRVDVTTTDASVVVMVRLLKTCALEQTVSNGKATITAQDPATLPATTLATDSEIISTGYYKMLMHFSCYDVAKNAKADDDDLFKTRKKMLTCRVST